MIAMLIVVLVLGAYLALSGAGSSLQPQASYTYLQGNLGSGETLGPDISYPYVINLDTAVSGPEFEDGGGGPLDRYYLQSNDPVLVEKLNNRIGQNVKVGGKIMWGYAETRYLKVETVE